MRNTFSYIYLSSDNSQFFDAGETGAPMRFINERELLLWTAQGDHVVYDVEANNIIRSERKKRLMGFNSDMTKLVVYDGGDEIHIEVAHTGQRLKSIKIPK